ncbi:MAG: outer membrane beta-barrel protein [Filimonas sp.]|nr:outer membrane beta-barrel protein [Filimonas sp.]
MRKILLASAMMLGLAFGANAQKGSTLLYGNVGFGNSKVGGVDGSTSTFEFTPGIGYQFNENWTIGAELGAAAASHSTPSFNAGPFIRYTHNFSSIFGIYGQLGVGYTHIGDATSYNLYGSEVGGGNGFYAAFTLPTIAINVHNGLAVNLGFGNVNFASVKPNYDGAKSSSAFGVNFGHGISLGISKNFGGKK